MGSIPLVDLAAQHAEVAAEVAVGCQEILDRTGFVGGPKVAAFESEYADFIGTSHCVGVGNGTDALVLVLDAMELGPGDEVICPAFTFYATAESIARRGATPVFAEIDPATFNLDLEDVARKVTPRTRAIMPVNLFGRPLPIEPLLELGNRKTSQGS